MARRAPPEWRITPFGPIRPTSVFSLVSRGYARAQGVSKGLVAQPRALHLGLGAAQIARHELTRRDRLALLPRMCRDPRNVASGGSGIGRRHEHRVGTAQGVRAQWGAAAHH